MCKPSFYYDNKIWVDWFRGDTNHLATIFCVNNNLKFEHLPGYYEVGGEQREFWTKKLQNTDNPKFYPNIHIFKDKRFLYHFKGGTGLEGFIKRDNGIINDR